MKRRLEPVAAPLFRGAYVRRTRRKSQRPTVTVRVSTRRVATAGLMSPRSSRGAAPRVCRTHAAFSGGYLSSSVSRFGEARPRWFKAVRRDAPPCLARPRPPESGVPHFVFLIAKSNFFPFVQSRGRLYDAASVYVKRLLTTLSGGSLGSCVDEERSQLRELM